MSVTERIQAVERSIRGGSGLDGVRISAKQIVDPELEFGRGDCYSRMYYVV